MKVDSSSVNPFAPYGPILGLDLLVGEEVVWDSRIYTEVRGSELWLCQDGNFFYACDSNGKVKSQKYWNPGYAVRAIVEMDPELPSKVKQFPLSDYR